MSRLVLSALMRKPALSCVWPAFARASPKKNSGKKGSAEEVEDDPDAARKVSN